MKNTVEYRLLFVDGICIIFSSPLPSGKVVTLRGINLIPKLRGEKRRYAGGDSVEMLPVELNLVGIDKDLVCSLCRLLTSENTFI